MGYYFENYLHDDRANNGKRRQTVNRAVKYIGKFLKANGGADFVAVCGCSGLSLGSIIAYELGLPCVIVRKEYDAQNSHCGGAFVSPDFHKPDSKYIIVDDFIAGGSTVKYIQDKLKHHSCIGFYGYTVVDDAVNKMRCEENDLTPILQ